MAFQFRLQSVLQAHQNQRDQQQQSVRLSKHQLSLVSERRDQIANSRDQVLEELRSLNASDLLNVEMAKQYRRYAEELALALSQADADVSLATQKLHEATTRLIDADQSLKKFEHLLGKEFSACQERQKKAETREFEDVMVYYGWSVSESSR